MAVDRSAEPGSTALLCIHGKSTWERCENCETDAREGRGTGFTSATLTSNERVSGSGTDVNKLLDEIERLQRESEIADKESMVKLVEERDDLKQLVEKLEQCHRQGWLHAQEVEDEYLKRMGHGFGVPRETTTALGPREPDNSMVICPACTCQFVAISVDDQAERRALREHIAWAWSIIASAGAGDWSKESADWREAAEKWERARDPYDGLAQKATCRHCGVPEGVFHAPNCPEHAEKTNECPACHGSGLISYTDRQGNQKQKYCENCRPAMKTNACCPEAAESGGDWHDVECRANQKAFENCEHGIPGKFCTALHEPAMAMLPNANHPGPGCSCRDCLSQYPDPRNER